MHRSEKKLGQGGVSFVDFLRRFEKMISSSEAVTPKSAKTYSHNIIYI